MKSRSRGGGGGGAGGGGGGGGGGRGGWEEPPGRPGRKSHDVGVLCPWAPAPPLRSAPGSVARRRGGGGLGALRRGGPPPGGSEGLLASGGLLEAHPEGAESASRAPPLFAGGGLLLLASPPGARRREVKHHPDKSPGPGATERFQRIVEAHQALKDTDGELAFPWERHPERQQVMTGMQVLRTFGPLAQEAANTDPIKAQMMQHVVKESTDCKVLIFERETTEGGSQVRETWADALCTDARNGSNHLVKVYRRIAVSGTSKGEDRILPSEESEIDPSDFDVVD
ncbi:unnamed protein product [Prorocentrum cordatum]|uniref:Uncharacterized protein n=1 Tax=Prorocentrum cordatum TaxID=2364126 RepID=A0ABN9S5P5_9DINO|nr:unnamed protein product [Polarella glacialis]